MTGLYSCHEDECKVLTDAERAEIRAQLEAEFSGPTKVNQVMEFRRNSMTMAQAFNEWMRRYVEEPERFKREWQAVGDFQRDVNAGAEPTYGQNCAAYLAEIMAG